jgi:hypothetical protein
MLGLPFLKLRWLVAAAVIAGGWTYVSEPPTTRKDTPRKQERVAPRPQAALPARVALPEKRPAKTASARTAPTRSSDLVTAAIPKAPIPAPRETPKAPLPVPKKIVAAAPKGTQPLRQPQAGDCQCPYDLMIDGSACGDGSAYVRLKRSRSACYR